MATSDTPSGDAPGASPVAARAASARGAREARGPGVEPGLVATGDGHLTVRHEDGLGGATGLARPRRPATRSPLIPATGNQRGLAVDGLRSEPPGGDGAPVAPAVPPVRRTARRQLAKVACLMMQKNEGVLLDLWLRYHAHVFGPHGLFVLDNGSTDPAVRRRLEEAEAEGVTVLWDYDQQEDFERKGKILQNLMREIEDDGYDFLMPLDCDEFVAHQALDGRISCEPEVVTGYLDAAHRRDPRVLLIRGSYFNVPERPGLYFFASERKCFFARGMVKALGMGFHQATSRRSDVEVRTGIVHFHYRYKPYRLFSEHAKQKLAARVADFSADEARQYRGKGSHLARFAAMGEEGYRRYFARFDRVRLSSFRKTLLRLGGDLPY